jgi:outer membrane protein assembly factor BamD (BamD/ComL family)
LTAVKTILSWRSLRRGLLASALGGAAGCSWDRFSLIKPPTPPPPPVESFVLRAEGLAADKPVTEGTPQAQLAGAHEFFRREDYDKAERLFHAVADNQKNAPALVQEALFYDAESYRLQGQYPKAADVYTDLNKKFRNNPYRDQANQRMFDIALFWLEDTWAEMREYDEKKQGKRWVVWPHFVSMEKKKPLLDREGRALQLLDEVRFNDLKGPLDDKALWVAGHVKLYHEDYREADQYFTQITELHPDSPFMAQAIELAIFSKQMATGGPDYDGRKCAEARKLVDSALRMPGVDDKKKQGLMNQLKGITAQQAAKDYESAEFYRRTGHPGSAYFMYTVVTRRYPGTEYARMAQEKLAELYEELKQKGGEEHRAPQAVAPAEAAPMPKRLEGVPQGGAPRALPSGLDR